MSLGSITAGSDASAEPGPVAPGAGHRWPYRLRPLGRSLAPAAVIILIQQVAFPAPAGIVVRGLVVGGLTALIALGMALVYRANRIINFAQADLGLAPTVLTFMLLDRAGVPYLVAVATGLVAAIALGATTERVVIRRFSRSPRLLVTIATIGLSQVLAAAALQLPRLWGTSVAVGRIAPPFAASRQIGGIVFDVNDLLALVVTPIVVAVVVVFLRSSDAGVAIRASADGRDRAALLGVPVDRLQTVVWAMSAALAFAAVFLRSGILDLPTGSALGFGILLRAITALVLGRMTNLVTVTSCAVALGAFELGFSWGHDPAFVEPVLAIAVVAVILWRQRVPGRADLVDASAWRSAPEIRPVPSVLARLPEVRAARLGGLAVVGAIALALPAVLDVDQVFKASALVIYAVLGLSLVLLTGWSGSVSLGQIGFFAIGAAVAGHAIGEWRLDLLPALSIASVAGAVAGLLVALPASRLHGLYIAVTTLALAIATTSYLLDHDRFSWVPSDRIARVPLLGGFDASSETGLYYLAVGVLALVIAGLRGVRLSRFGRAVVAVRDNEPAAMSYAVDAVRLRVSAFVLSGAIAALAGGLFVQHERAFDPSSYALIQNFVVLTMVVIGGMSSLAGAVLGALFLFGARWFLGTDWQFLASGLGVLLVLLVAPGGLASLVYRLRDRWLRVVATRRGLGVPGYSAAAEDVSTAGRGPARPGTASGPGVDSESGAPLLRVSAVEVGYGQVPVLFGVDLDVRAGEAVALLGTNGAGKSTLVRAISGLLAPTAGEIIFAGQRIGGRPAPEIAARGLSQMPGGAGVFPTLTVAENLRVAGWLKRRARAEVSESRERLLQQFPVLDERADEPASNLSGGQQQMLALAMAVLVRPRLLVIDELSLGLAPVVVSQLMRFVDHLRDEGTALVVVEQSVNVALSVADRAVFLERGQVRFAGPAADLLDRPDLLRSVFLGAAAQAGGSAAAGFAPLPAGTGPARAGTGPGEQPTAATGGPARPATPATEPRSAPSGGPADAWSAVSPAPAVEARGLTVSFGGVRAVEAVSFEVARGEIVGIIGPNGAGKTTLLDLLGGGLRPEAGQVLLGGARVTRLGAAARARRGLGRSFQDARLFPSLTVDEAVAVACERWVRVTDPLSAALHLPSSLDSESAVSRRVDELVELLGLASYRSLFVGELSTGTRRVVDLACLLAHRPNVVLLDEPAAGIAQREVEQLAPLVRRIRDETGASLVVVEHDIPLVTAVADRVVAMDQGRVVAAGRPADVLASPAVVTSYLGDDQVAIQRSGNPHP